MLETWGLDIMIFLSDLDRTMIFSYKRLSPDENLCVEIYNDRQVSFMTHRSAALFTELISKVHFIPITTRSREQYERIVFPEGYIPEYAVIDNGANLLKNGIIDEEWHNDFREIISDAVEELKRCRVFLESLDDVYYKPKMVDDSFIFAKCYNPYETLSKMSDVVKNTKTEFFRNGEKIYAIPNGISKKSALDKLRVRFPTEDFIAAGDSLFDYEMLCSADVSIVKYGELSGHVMNGLQISETENDDPDFVLNQLKKIIQNR